MAERLSSGATRACATIRAMPTPRHILLVSNSTCHGQGYLDHCEAQVKAALGGVSRVLFVPYALFDREAYAEKVSERLARMGFGCEPIHRAPDPRRAVAEAEAVFIGGGNTFRLLAELYRHELLQPIRERVVGGMPYVGSSAGSNVACRSIRTTNDMPIVEPPSFAGLALVPFNLNPHYLDPDPGSTHMGETREERIAQFHEENDPPVVGLREGAMLSIEGERMTLEGDSGARIFLKSQPAREYVRGARLDWLLEA